MKKLLITIGCVIIISCVKEEMHINDIENLTNAEVNKEIIIEGYLTSEMSIQRVKLSKPSKIGDFNKYTPINTAEVFLTDGEKEYWYY